MLRKISRRRSIPILILILIINKWTICLIRTLLMQFNKILWILGMQVLRNIQNFSPKIISFIPKLTIYIKPCKCIWIQISIQTWWIQANLRIHINPFKISITQCPKCQTLIQFTLLKIISGHIHLHLVHKLLGLNLNNNYKIHPKTFININTLFYRALK